MALPRYEGFVPLPGPERRQASVQTADLQAIHNLTQATDQLINIAGNIHQGRAHLQAEEALIETNKRANLFIENLQQNHEPSEWDGMFQKFREETLSEIHGRIRNPQGQRLFNERAEVEMEKIRHGVALQQINREQQLGTQQAMRIAEAKIEAGDFKGAVEAILYGIQQNYFHGSAATELFMDVQRRAFLRETSNQLQDVFNEYGYEAALSLLNDPTRFSQNYIDVFPTGKESEVVVLDDETVQIRGDVPGGSTIPIMDDRARDGLSKMLSDMESNRLEVEKQGRARRIESINQWLSQIMMDENITSATMRAALRHENAEPLFDPNYETGRAVLNRWVDKIQTLENRERAAGTDASKAEAAALRTEVALRLQLSDGSREATDEIRQYFNDRVFEVGYEFFTSEQITSTANLIENFSTDETSKAMAEILNEVRDAAISSARGGKLSDEQTALFAQAVGFIESHTQQIRNGEIPRDIERSQRMIRNLLEAPIVANISQDLGMSLFNQTGWGGGLWSQQNVEKAKQYIQEGRYGDGLWRHPRFRPVVDEANLTMLQSFFRDTGRGHLAAEARESYLRGGAPKLDDDGNELPENLIVFQTPSTGQAVIMEMRNNEPSYVTFAYVRSGMTSHYLQAYRFIGDERENPQFMTEIDVDDGQWAAIELMGR